MQFELSAPSKAGGTYGNPLIGLHAPVAAPSPDEDEATEGAAAEATKSEAIQVAFQVTGTAAAQQQGHLVARVVMEYTAEETAFRSAQGAVLDTSSLGGAVVDSHWFTSCASPPCFARAVQPTGHVLGARACGCGAPEPGRVYGPCMEAVKLRSRASAVQRRTALLVAPQATLRDGLPPLPF